MNQNRFGLLILLFHIAAATSLHLVQDKVLIHRTIKSKKSGKGKKGSNKYYERSGKKGKKQGKKGKKGGKKTEYDEGLEEGESINLGTALSQHGS